MDSCRLLGNYNGENIYLYSSAKYDRPRLFYTPNYYVWRGQARPALAPPSGTQVASHSFEYRATWPAAGGRAREPGPGTD